MKLITSTAILLAAGLSAAPAGAQMYGAPASAPPPQTAAQGQNQEQASGKQAPHPSSHAMKALMDLQASVKANDFANVPAKVAAAQAVAQTKEDKYLIGALQRQAALAAKDYTSLASAVETLANSGYLEPNKVAALYLDLGVQQYNSKQFGPAVASFQRATSLTPNDPQALELLGQGLSSAGQKAEAASAFERSFQARAATGQKPTEDMFRRAVQASYDAKSPSAVGVARQWLAAYPSPDSWRNALAVYRSVGNPDPASALDIMRLARATNSMGGTADFNLYAAETINASNFGEAKAMLAEGLTAGKIKSSDPVIADIQKALAGKASPTSAELATREAGAKVGSAFMRVGDAYYGAANYAKAADMYRQAVAKGADPNVANLRLGEALAVSGDKAGAAAALGKVGGSQSEIAKFWLVYANRSA